MNVVKPPSEEKSLLALRRLYEDAERDIIKVITRKRSLDQVDYAEVAALERVQTILTNMQTEAGEYIPRMVEKYFYDETKKDMSGYENALSLTSTQTNITQLLTNNLLGELMAASETCFSSAAKFYTLGRLEADEYRKAALEGVMTHEASIESWWVAQRKMAAKLNAQGITCFVDKAGRNWSLSAYCSMATRTTARQAQVAAAITVDDYDLWQIVKIGSTCPLCAVYEGRVYSKSGTNPDYPSLAMAFGKIDPEGPNGLENTYLNIHPNCQHSIVRYTTIGKTEDQIQKDKDFSSFEKNPATVDPRTKKQREAYRKKEANRRKYIEDLNQWRKYRAALGKDVPSFERFREAKINGSDVYKNLEYKYRSFSIKASKAVENLESDGIIGNHISGAVSGARNPAGNKALEHAIKYYESVRHMTTDVEKIARNTGFSEDKIRQIKNYVFIDKHDLGGGTIDRFDPDYMMAESWRRLIEGKPEAHDITMLRHELMEDELMRGGLTQDEAHKRASMVYNYNKEAEEYYGKIKKFRKD